MKNSGSDLKAEINGRENPLRWSCNTILPAKVGTNFADNLRLLGRYSLLSE
jgi:hypothetical protein